MTQRSLPRGLTAVTAPFSSGLDRLSEWYSGRQLTKALQAVAALSPSGLRMLCERYPGLVTLETLNAEKAKFERALKAWQYRSWAKTQGWNWVCAKTGMDQEKIQTFIRESEAEIEQLEVLKENLENFTALVQGDEPERPS